MLFASQGRSVWLLRRVVCCIRKFVLIPRCWMMMKTSNVALPSTATPSDPMCNSENSNPNC